MIGGALAGLSGALLVEFIGAWAPSGWLYPETFVFFTAVIVGGRGSVFGVAIGAALIGVGIQQAVQYMPIGSDPTVLAAAEWIITGVLTLVFLWVAPAGTAAGATPTVRRRLRGVRSVTPRAPMDARSSARARAVGARGDAQARPPSLVSRGARAPAAHAGTDSRRRRLLVVDDLAKAFGGVRAVDGVSLPRAGRCDGRHDRPQRRRQVDGARDDRRGDPPRPRRDLARRRANIAGSSAVVDGAAAASSARSRPRACSPG